MDDAMHGQNRVFGAPLHGQRVNHAQAGLAEK